MAKQSRQLSTILLVDDEPGVLNALRRQLQEEYHVLTAASGDAAIKIVSEEKVALIIADQRMPGMTGAELLRRTRGISPDTVRILITAYADLNATIEAVNQGGIFNYIAKPWEPEELSAVVRSACETFALRQENKRLMAQLQKDNPADSPYSH